MLDFVSDGQPLQTPVGAANAQFLTTPPDASEVLGAFAGASSSTGFVQREMERTNTETEATNAAPTFGSNRGIAAPVYSKPAESPESAEDINKAYGPVGPDGNQVKITDKPMLASVAKLIGKTKADEIDREGVISRYENSHGALASFGMGLAGFIQDPLNIASMFVPGLGEEAALSAVGRVGLTAETIAGRTAARGVMGATAGVAGQAPLTALQYGLGQQEASDYDARSALKDLAFGAAGGALMHGGLVGGLHEAGILKPDDLIKAGIKVPTDLDKSIIGASAVDKDAAMRSSISQLVTGREVQVDDIFKGNADYAQLIDHERQIYRDGAEPGMTPDELEKATNDIFKEDEEHFDATKVIPKKPPVEVPNTKPESVLEFIRNRGGVTDESGEIANMGGDRAHINEETGKPIPFQRKLIRPSDKLDQPDLLGGGTETVKSKYAPENVAQALQHAGYFPEHGERIATEHDLYAKIDKELRGEKQWPNHFIEEAAHDPAYMEELSKHISEQEQEKLARDIGNHHQHLMDEAERLEKEFMESRGDAWTPEVVKTRSLEDLENEYRQESAARESQQSYGGNEAQSSAGDKGRVSESGGQRSGSAESTGRTDEQSDTGSNTGIEAIDERKPEIDALESQIDTSNMTADELEEVTAISKAYDDAIKSLTDKQQAMAACLARTGV